MNSAMSIMMTRVGAVMKRAQRGLFGGKRILFGNTISHSEKRNRRTWKPNVQTIKLYSELLETDIRIKMTTFVLRQVDRMGGLDRYLLYTPDVKLDSALGVKLKAKLTEAYKSKTGKEFNYRNKNAVLPLGTYVRPQSAKPAAKQSSSSSSPSTPSSSPSTPSSPSSLDTQSSS